MSFLSGLVNIAGKVAAVLTHPIQSATKGTDFVVNEIKNQSSLVAYGTPILEYATAAAAVVSGGSAFGVKSATTAIGSKIISTATSLIPSTTKGKLIAAAVVPVVASAIIQNPTKAAQLPGQILNFQSNVGGLIANPSISKVVETAKENPVLSTLIGGAIVATVAGGVGLAANTIATYTNSKATKENTQLMEIPSSDVTSTIDPSKTIQIINQIPSPVSPAPISTSPVPPVEASAMAAPGGSTPKKKKKTTKKKVKAKKKTRRSKKKKKKSIKRSKS